MGQFVVCSFPCVHDFVSWTIFFCLFQLYAFFSCEFFMYGVFFFFFFLPHPHKADWAEGDNTLLDLLFIAKFRR